MHEDPGDEVVFTVEGHFDWYWAPVDRQEYGLAAAIERFAVPADQVKVSPRPICRCCGDRLPRAAVYDQHKRCRRHLLRNPCAIAGCSRTHAVGDGGFMHDGRDWLCGEHWRMACPPHSAMRRTYHRFFRTVKKLGVAPGERWPADIERRFWRFWQALVARARRKAAGDLDMGEISKMFGWEE